MPPRQEETAAAVCSGCDQEPCHVCGACPCDEDRDWACRNQYEHWRIPPE